MKFLLLALLTTFTLAAADMLPLKESSKELNYITTSDFECNYYLELAGQDLLSLSNYNKSTKPSNLYESFMNHSTKAKELCISINKLIVEDITEIQDDITDFYNQNYK